MVIELKVRGKPGYLKQTLYEWLLHIKEILESELNESIEIVTEDSEEELPSLIINDNYVGSGLPGEEGYLIEIIKHAVRSMKDHVDARLCDNV